jgi:hypothetical protein
LLSIRHPPLLRALVLSSSTLLLQVLVRDSTFLYMAVLEGERAELREEAGRAELLPERRADRLLVVMLCPQA